MTFDNGVPQQTYGVADIGSALPEASKTGYLFRGWLFDKTGDECFKTLSEALWSALFEGEAGDLTVDATASLTRRSSGGAPSGTVTPSYTVSASAGEGGSISPSGKTSVDKGDDLTACSALAAVHLSMAAIRCMQAELLSYAKIMDDDVFGYTIVREAELNLANHQELIDGLVEELTRRLTREKK